MKEISEIQINSQENIQNIKKDKFEESLKV